MAYTDPNFPTKKALRDALAAGQMVGVFQPGLGYVLQDGTVSLESRPKPHPWYATGLIRGGRLVSVG